ncbi:sulfotransferase domain-containing protein [Pseudomonadales bacterium]|nr:sulfotransferase domain-containing protein [Pseudomonadales bacterium]
MKLDFLIIGAQKSATTALFKYLEPHADIAMPKGKEAPLFHHDVNEAEVSAFMAEQFGRGIGKLRGKATPQYMCDEAIPLRLKQHNPDLKLIAVLRDPIERAWSQYRMNRRRETEQRTFDEAVSELLQPDTLTKARAGSAPMHTETFESEGDYYLAWSEYGRILENYLRHFNRDQLLVLYTEDIQNEPQATLDKVMTFLGLDEGFTPDCLGEVIHKGGSEAIVSKQLKQRIRNFGPVKVFWDRIPEPRRRVIRYWFEQLNVKKSDDGIELSASQRAKLQMHFAKDAQLLASVTGEYPIWAEQNELQCA